MSVISLELAMHHVLAEQEDQTLVEAFLDAAEDSASQFMQRRFFASQEGLDDAISEVPGLRSDALAKFRAAESAADELAESCERFAAREIAKKSLEEAFAECDMRARGILLNKSVQAACLLILGHLFANREDVVVGSTAVELPMGSRSLLAFYRVGMGV